MPTRPLRLSLAAAILICLSAGRTAHGQVTSATLSAGQPLTRSDCPAVVTFNGSITSDRAGTVTYVFTRSDGTTDTVARSLVFRKAGTLPVGSNWTLGGMSLPFYRGWQAIRVLSPNPLTSPQATFELNCNPPLNSAIAAHGNTDWHIDTANEFLFGTDMAGNDTAPNHAPDGWSRRHLHLGMDNTSRFYHDRGKSAAGSDIDAVSGIDRAMLFFYAGHGNPLRWSTLGDTASPAKMSLANVDGGGMLRYYWHCSCEVFAHGPRVCADGGADYSCPQGFGGGADSPGMRNLFERWGPALTPDLRMACGMSTLAYCHESNVSRVWDNFSNHGMSVADSFINGFGDWGVVPLCITTGGPDVTATPLYDATFTNKPNDSGTTHYHVRYASVNASAAKPLEINRIPRILPRFKLAPAEVSPTFRRMSLRPTSSLDSFAGGKVRIRIEPKSGAVFLTAVQPKPSPGADLSEREQLARAKRLITDLGWYDSELGEPVITRMMNASMPIDGNAAAIKRSQDGVLITYRRHIEVDRRRIEILGEGGVTIVRMANDGSIMGASRVWRRILPDQGSVRIKSFEEARKEALARTGKGDAYRLDQWKFGFKEHSAGVQGDELKAVYQFAFVPKHGAERLNVPPRLVEIAAEK